MFKKIGTLACVSILLLTVMPTSHATDPSIESFMKRIQREALMMGYTDVDRYRELHHAISFSLYGDYPLELSMSDAELEMEYDSILLSGDVDGVSKSAYVEFRKKQLYEEAFISALKITKEELYAFLDKLAMVDDVMRAVEEHRYGILSDDTVEVIEIRCHECGSQNVSNWHLSDIVRLDAALSKANLNTNQLVNVIVHNIANGETYEIRVRNRTPFHPYL